MNIEEINDDDFGDDVELSVPDQILAELSEEDAAVFDESEVVSSGVDGGSGYDTLHVKSLSDDPDEAFTFDHDSAQGISNIETLDFSDEAGDVSVNLSIDDVMGMTEEGENGIHSLEVVVSSEDDTVMVGDQEVSVGTSFSSEGIELTVKIESESEVAV